jgi:hypothetical protein
MNNVNEIKRNSFNDKTSQRDSMKKNGIGTNGDLGNKETPNENDSNELEKKHFAFTNHGLNVSNVNINGVINEPQNTNGHVGAPQNIPRKVTLSWRSITVKAPPGACGITSVSKCKLAFKPKKIILKNVDGIVKPGQMVALMGAR